MKTNKNLLLSAFIALGLLFLPTLDAQAQSKKISDLTALTGAATASNDEFVIVDTDAGSTKKITRTELTTAVAANIAQGELADDSVREADLMVVDTPADEECLTFESTIGDFEWQACGSGGEDAFTAESTPGANPTATGTDAIGIGDAAVAGNAAGDLGVLAIGARSSALGVNAIALGENADADGANSVAIGGHTTDGSSADATASNSVAIGANSLSDAANGTAIGSNADAGGQDATAIGFTASASNISAVAIGDSALASGGRDTAIGPNSTASGGASVAIGRNADSTGANCVAIGGNNTDTDSADCSAASSIALGQHILADDVGEFAWAAVEFAAQSDTHESKYHLVIATTDATQTELSTDNAAAGAANDISVASDCTASINITITARRTDADGESASYTRIALFDNDAGTTAIVGAITSVSTIEDTAAWDVTLTADDTNDGINVLVTGEAAKTIRWTGIAQVIETCG